MEERISDDKVIDVGEQFTLYLNTEGMPAWGKHPNLPMNTALRRFWPAASTPRRDSRPQFATWGPCRSRLIEGNGTVETGTPGASLRLVALIRQRLASAAPGYIVRGLECPIREIST
jgi:hypothetical protein